MKKARRSKRGKRKSRKGLGALGTAKEIGKDSLNPVAVVLGYTGASLLGSLMDKVAFITPDPTKEGFQFKKLIKPLLFIAAGITISSIANHAGKGDKTTMGRVFIKNIGYGVTAAGVISGTKAFIKKDLFDGLGAAGSTNAKYLNESKDLLKKIIEQNAKMLDLDNPGGGESSPANGGMGAMDNTFEPALDLDSQEAVL